MKHNRRLSVSIIVTLLIVVAVFLTFNFVFFSVGQLAIDGSANNRAGAVTSLSISLTTSKAPDVVVVLAASNSTVTMSVSDTSALSWQTRQSFSATQPSIHTMYEFYAITSSALSGDSITVSQSVASNLDIVGFAVSGANTSSPFDSNAGLPAQTTNSGTAPNITISTTNPNDMILGLLGSGAETSVTPGSGFTLIVTPFSNPVTAAEYEVVSTAQSNLVVGYTVPTSRTWIMFGDAIKASVSSGGGGGGGGSSTTTSTTTTTTSYLGQSVATSVTNSTTTQLGNWVAQWTGGWITSEAALIGLITIIVIVLGAGAFAYRKRKG